MLINSSNDSLLPPHQSSMSSTDLNCYITSPNSFLFITLYTINIITVLPLCIIIIYYGVKQWQKRHSTSSAETMSHTDCFTYHMVIIELIGVFKCVFSCWGIYRKNLILLSVNSFLITFVWHAQTLFHTLTCVERYLAVAKPVFYLSLRNERGIRARNTCIGTVWLLCCIMMGLALRQKFLVVVDSCIIVLTFATVSFCSFNVLCILIRPGPGRQDRERAGQSKQRAFYAMVAILCVLIVRFAWSLVWAFLILSEERGQCLMMISSVLLDLPSSLVLPLLFLHRKGKMVCKKSSM